MYPVACFVLRSRADQFCQTLWDHFGQDLKLVVETFMSQGQLVHLVGLVNPVGLDGEQHAWLVGAAEGAQDQADI